MTNWKAMAGLAVLLGVIFLTQATAQRDDKKKEPDPAKKDPGKDPSSKDASSKPATHKVEKKHFKIELTVKGILESDEAHAIAYRHTPVAGMPFNPGSLTVLKAVAHGSVVKPGEVLVAFDTQRIDQAIAQVEAELKVLAAGIKLAQEEQPLFEKSMPVELEVAERGKKEADEDLAYFLKTAKAETEKRANQYVKRAAFSLEYAKEQLRQLEKMYKANDLTEETEQIILKRQRYDVEEATEYFKSAELERDYVLKTMLPRREKAFRDGVVKQTMVLEKVRATQTPQATQKKNHLAKMQFDRDRLEIGLETLRKDRAAMNVVAPVGGIVYYGRLGAGQWESAASLAGRLVPHGSVSPDEVFMTVVKTRPLVLRVGIEEKDVQQLQPGLEGKAKLVAFGDLKVAAKVQSVAAVPASPGKFEARVTVDLDNVKTAMPGMSAAVHFVPYSKKDALVIPSSALLEEDDKNFVEVLKDGKREKREITTGRVSGQETEVLDGLREGDEVLLERAPAKKADSGKGGE